MMHSNPFRTRFLISLACLSVVAGCSTPTLQEDMLLGTLIANGTCEGKRIYLLSIASVSAYKTGFTAYNDTLTIKATPYKRVVQLDTTLVKTDQLTFLQQHTLQDKLAITFINHHQSILPSCFRQPIRTIETVAVTGIGSASF